MAAVGRRRPVGQGRRGGGTGTGGPPPVAKGTAPAEASCRFPVRLLPRAGTTRIDGVVAGRLHARVARPPAAGEANEALVALLAEALGLPPSAVRIVAGRRSRDKVVEVPARAQERLRTRWPEIGLSSVPSGPGGEDPGRVGD
jgi:hypothetical protein